jgi:signal transduction histidine kinase/response regulator RpfG family c-di-GMP phosphodiesterase
MTKASSVLPAPSFRSGPSSGERERVLLVDDEPQVLVALEDLLSDDFVVLKTESPETALRIVKDEGNIAVIVTDQRMPRMTGDQLLSTLADSSSASRILVTGYADLSAVIRAVNEGKIFAYVTKPWSPDDLRMKVQKAAEHFRLVNELTRERQLLSRILDSLEDGVVALDTAGNVTAFNPRAEMLLGCGPREFVPADWIGACGAYLPDQKTPLPKDRDPLAHAMAGKSLKDADIYVKNLRVPGVELTVAATPLRDAGRALIGGIAVFRDVTERRRLERQLSQAQKMEAVGQLAGGVAHDFNNLLAVITGYGEFLLERFEEGDSAHEDLTQLLSASQRAAQLTKQLLAFSRRQVVQPKILELNSIVANVEKMLRRVIGEDIDLKTVLAPDLWSVRADAGQLEQVIVNLTVNARDAMPNGGAITVETENVTFGEEYPLTDPRVKPGAYVVLALSDTGGGMDSETQVRVFEPFFTTKEPGKGTGLGLATVYGIIEQLDGFIRLRSELGVGTTFKIYLPRASGSEQPATARRTIRPAAANATILLVEDEDAVRNVTARMLESRGYSVLEARDADAARAACAEHGSRIDLLLTDIVMPKTSGPKLAEELIANHPGLRVLYMSGYSGAALSRHATLPEGVGYLEKPFTASTLATKVLDALESEDMQRGS